MIYFEADLILNRFQMLARLSELQEENRCTNVEYADNQIVAAAQEPISDAVEDREDDVCPEPKRKHYSLPHAIDRPTRTANGSEASGQSMMKISKVMTLSRVHRVNRIDLNQTSTSDRRIDTDARTPCVGDESVCRMPPFQAGKFWNEQTRNRFLWSPRIFRYSNMDRAGWSWMCSPLRSLRERRSGHSAVQRRNGSGADAARGPRMPTDLRAGVQRYPDDGGAPGSLARSENIGTQLFTGDSSRTFDINNAPRRDALLRPTRDHAFVDFEKASEVRLSQATVFEKGWKINLHFSLVAQLATNVNSLCCARC